MAFPLGLLSFRLRPDRSSLLTMTEPLKNYPANLQLNQIKLLSEILTELTSLTEKVLVAQQALLEQETYSSNGSSPTKSVSLPF